MKNTLTLAALSLHLLLGLAPAARAGNFITTNTTINTPQPASPINLIGYSSTANESSKTNPFSPTVDLTMGGSFTDNLNVYNSSILNITGGSVSGSVNANNSSTINLSSGSVGGGIDGTSGATIYVSGGTVGGGVSANGTSIVTISGGSFGGAVSGTGTSVLNISGGSIAGGLNGDEGSTINLSGGILGGTASGPNSKIMYDASGGAVLNIYGTGLSLTPYNNVAPGSTGFLLTGNLQDGTSVDGRLITFIGGDPQVNLYNTAPEPSSLALLTIGGALGLAGAAWRKRSLSLQQV